MVESVLLLIEVLRRAILTYWQCLTQTFHSQKLTSDAVRSISKKELGHLDLMARQSMVSQEAAVASLLVMTFLQGRLRL